MQTGVGWCEASRWPCVPGAVPTALLGSRRPGRATARCHRPREQPPDGHRHRSPGLLAAAGGTDASALGSKQRSLNSCQALAPLRVQKRKEKGGKKKETVTLIHSQASLFLPFFFFHVKPLFYPSWHITYRLRKSQSHKAQLCDYEKYMTFSFPDLYRANY